MRKKSRETREQILGAALKLFNKKGVESVTIRAIAAEAGISHGNLLYHFAGVESIVLALHAKLRSAAVSLNEDVKAMPEALPALVYSIERGFPILYAYRFFMINLNDLVRRFPEVRRTLHKAESLRKKMYSEAIQAGVKQGSLRRENYPGEYEHLIDRIRIFSDYWPASAEIYDSGSPDKIIKKYAHLFVSMLYPYVTDKGKVRLDFPRSFSVDP
ncbi:MAG: TetR family transcriptional regulator [Leptospiraceae bacterium]|nr:TetR family transcriptional regulator [Leptospiraceae bacterium]MCB1316455.1 TetR family transcriptional regulator [Leptospiraceae bacterium]